MKNNKSVYMSRDTQANLDRLLIHFESIGKGLKVSKSEIVRIALQEMALKVLDHDSQK